MSKPVRIGIVAGEASGDQLGAGLLAALKRHFPHARYSGIGGQKMLAEGFESLYPMDRLSVMGLTEPLKRLPELLKIRRQLKRHFISQQFDLVIGIDSPDFNLGLELKLKKAGITTAHYVSPSVWAWRQGRIKKIARAVDMMLTLLPFEAAFYRQHNVPVTFVGHPLAEQLPLETDTAHARAQLGLHIDKKVLTLMPGSRGSEVKLLGEIFLQVAQNCCEKIEGLQIVLPAASSERRQQLEAQLAGFPSLPVKLIDGQSLTAMAAADAVLLASGTTALEAMLLKKPMVVSYRLSRTSFFMLSRLVKTDYYSLPNLLAGRQLVPELVQSDATAEKLTEAILPMLADSAEVARLQHHFHDLHQQLRQGGSEKAAQVLAGMINRG